jgi:DNA polymerase-3 subunit epsilon
MRARVEELAAGELFENAARLRDRTAEVVLALRRMQRLAALTALDQLVAARPAATGGWEFAVIRSGRLASAGCARRGIHPMPVVDALVLTAETVVPDATPLRGASPEEAGLLARWLDQEDTRIVSASAGWCEPARGAGSWSEWCALARAGSASTRDAESRPPAPGSADHRLGWRS